MGDHQRLKQLILGEELAELNAHAERVAALETVQAGLPQQLPALLTQAQQGDGRQRLARALATPVADALGAAVETQRQRIVDVLFPVIGPAIRRAIAEALRDFNENFNRALESSFTPRGLRWRLESWHTGVPYAQVVLRHALKYRLDHLFLIERESGLVLARESAPDLADLDADAIAGMLTAIGDFVRDSVGAADGDGGLASASVGEHLVWVLEGPYANLAAFLRGTPPPLLRTLLRERLEQIHAQLDAAPTAAEAGLQQALRLDRLEADALAQASGADVAPTRRWPLIALALVAVALLGVWQWREWHWQQRMAVLETTLANWPGLYVDAVDGRDRRQVRVRGLIDADAQPPEPRIRDLLPAGTDVALSLRGYVSTEDPIVLQRLRRELDLPSGVRIQVNDGLVHLDGEAEAPWIAGVRERAQRVVGVVSVDASRLRASGDALAPLRAEWQSLVDGLPQQRVHFLRDLEPRDPAEFDALRERVARLAALAPTLGQPLRLHCLGHNDEPGSTTTNRALRARRAHWLCDRLQRAGIPTQALVADPDANPPMIDARAASLRPAAASAEGE